MTGKLINQLGGQSHLEEALKRNLGWIVKSFRSNNNLGSSSHSNILGKFSSPYLETTGYLLPTLLSAAKYFNDTQYSELAFKQISFFKKYKNDDGSFFQNVNTTTPIIFDTSQILLGLCTIYKTKKTKEVHNLIKQVYNWLNDNLNDQGSFIKYNYSSKTCPGYYSRVFWAMLMGEEITFINNKNKIFKGLGNIVSDANDNFSFSNWGFENEKFVLTHNIAYTLRGLYECSIILDNNINQLVINSIDTIVDMIKSAGQLCGTYDEEWNPDCSFVCSTGNAQMAILLSIIDEVKYQDTIVLLINPLLNAQKKSGPNKGAVASSIPIWGKYQRWRYTNWTQKFFCDALISILNLQK